MATMHLIKAMMTFLLFAPARSCYEHYQPVLDENLRAYHLGHLHFHHSNRVAAAIPETLIVYQVKVTYGIQGYHRCSIAQCIGPSLQCHVASSRF